MEEFLDVLTKTGERTGIVKSRVDVHRDGDYHKAVNVWIFAESTQELLLQKRADCKDSWPGKWDISSAGHISAGDTPILSARREVAEELGLNLPEDAFEMIFLFLQECTLNHGHFINNEFSDVYLVTTTEPIPLEAFTLQESEVSAVMYIHWEEYRYLLAQRHADFVFYDPSGQYAKLFSTLEKRYKVSEEERCISLSKQLDHYIPVALEVELAGLSEGDTFCLVNLIKAAMVIDDIFCLQVWYNNPALRDWLKSHSDSSRLDHLKWMCYCINKSPWQCLEENAAFLTTADSAVKLLPACTKFVSGWDGLKYRAAFPALKPPGANFYPPDMDKLEFEYWKNSLTNDQQKEATGPFSAIRRQTNCHGHSSGDVCHLSIVPFSIEYSSFLFDAARLLQKGGTFTGSASLKRLLEMKAEAFLSNDYYHSDIAWMDLDSRVDVTIGPYEAYEDSLFGYKATFKAFIGIRDDQATAQVKLFSDHLQELEDSLPIDDAYKSRNASAPSIRVIQLIYNAGDVKGPQGVAFNLLNHERVVAERGTAMVILKNISEAKFKHVLRPIAEICIKAEQKQAVDFESFFTHSICRECFHGIGPHTIRQASGHETTVRLELQELHSALEEAKADILGLWALKCLIERELFPKDLTKSMYVSFLVGCFRSVRFGLLEAHGRGQALQFNWLYEKGAFIMDSDGAFCVDFAKIPGALESLCRKILTIQARGDKEAANSLLETYAKVSPPLHHAMKKLESIQVPVDIKPLFLTADRLLKEFLL